MNNRSELYKTKPVSDAVLHPNTLPEHTAYWLSNIFSPPVLGIALLVVASLNQPTPDIWAWAGVYLVFALLIPFAFLVWQLKRGHIADIEVYHREQRSGSLLISAAGCAAAGILLLILGAPAIYPTMAAVGLLMWLSVFLITLRWKISVHSASATAGTLMMLHILGARSSFLLLIIPAVAWSRVKLKRHTALQTFAGTGLSVMIFIIVVSGASLFS